MTCPHQLRTRTASHQAACLPLAEQRKIIRVIFDVRIQRTANHGQNEFGPERVLISPRV